MDVMAAAPLVCATSLGRAQSMATQNAGVLLDQFRAVGVVVKVTHRSARQNLDAILARPLHEEDGRIAQPSASGLTLGGADR